MRRINSLLEEKPESATSPHVPQIEPLSGKIEFHNVSFSYDGHLRVLRNISFAISPGETVAIVGRIGVGKTTLLNLLLRLYELQEGEILFDGKDIRSIPLDTLRRNIGYVPQDIFLFSDTVKENIGFGSPGAAGETIVEGAKLTQIYDEVMAFPRQFETIVGEKGVILSGGQKQRISIARTLLLPTPILLFDDALSSVDTHTEERIVARLRPIIADKTTIIVTHRVSSIKDVDRIYVIEDGEIREQGNHIALVAMGGIYAKMFHHQRIERELENNDLIIRPFSYET
jgi:ATP-binding cassette subfamily B protein